MKIGVCAGDDLQTFDVCPRPKFGSSHEKFDVWPRPYQGNIGRKCIETLSA